MNNCKIFAHKTYKWMKGKRKKAKNPLNKQKQTTLHKNQYVR